MKIHHIALISLLLISGIFPAISQERPGCFQRKPSGEYESLNHICQPEIPRENVPAPEIDGIELSHVLIDNSRGIRFVAGIIKNKSDSDVIIQSITIQFVDKSDGNVITSERFLLGQTRLRPGQTREFREQLTNIMSLGGRRSHQMNIEFIGWE